jgi:hypothetical protein
VRDVIELIGRFLVRAPAGCRRRPPGYITMICFPVNARSNKAHPHFAMHEHFR